MYLTETRKIRIVWAQFRYTLKSNINFVSTMIAVQILTMLFSLLGLVTSGSIGYVQFTEKIIYGDIIIGVTLVLFVAFSFSLCLKPSMERSFSFVSNRMSWNLSNMAILGMLSIVCGFIVVLYSLTTRMMIYLMYGRANIVGEGFFIPPSELIMGVLVAIVYLLLAGAMGYLAGSIFQRSRIILFVCIVGIIAELVMELRVGGRILLPLFHWMVNEQSPVIFVMKMLLVAGVFFVSCIFLTNRQEVRV